MVVCCVSGCWLSFVVCCLLVAAYYSLCVVRSACSLCVVCCLFCVAVCSLCAGCWLLSVCGLLLFVVRCPLSAICCYLFDTCLSVVVCCLLRVHCVLCVVCRLLIVGKKQVCSVRWLLFAGCVLLFAV